MNLFRRKAREKGIDSGEIMVVREGPFLGGEGG